MSDSNIYFIHIPKNAGTSIKKLIHTNLRSRVKYMYHNVDPSKLGDKKTFIVLRDPLDRFTSAVRYAVQHWSSEPHIKKLISIGITEPNEWAEILADPDNKHREYVLAEIINNNHLIGDLKPKMKWTYTPQYYWYSTPTYVLLYDNLEEDFSNLMKEIGCENVKLPKVNNTTKECVAEFSDKGRKYLMELYAKDYELINEIKEKRKEKREKK